MSITRVGLGAWAIGGAGWSYGWGEQNDDESVAAIRHAVESGINWIDTAAVYGLGHSEEIVAKALEGIPQTDRPYVFTKGGLVWDEENHAATPRRVGAPESIRHGVDASLKRLGVDRIDLYQMHWPAEDGTPVEEYWRVFRDLIEEGKIRAAGLSNHSRSQLQAAESIGHVDSCQPPFSLIHSESGDEIIPWSRSNGTAVIVYSPMASGLLTGAFTEERAASLPKDDWRSKSRDFSGEGLKRNLDIVDRLRSVASRHGVSVGAVAVAWTLSVPGVSGAIVGARNSAQVDGWLPAASLTLTEQDLTEIHQSLQ
jgi:aryl-alcohol dehydrogenase-like predicted oxidoreductase